MREVSPFSIRKTFPAAIAAAILSALAAAPYFRYLVYTVMPEAGYGLPSDISALFFSQLGAVLFVSFISALAGFHYSRVCRLPGLGSTSYLLKNLPVLLLSAALLGALSYLLFDRHFILISPASYPSTAGDILSVSLKNAVTEEVIARLGITTLAVALLKNRKYGVILGAAVNALFTLRYPAFIGVREGLGLLFPAQLALALISGIVTGYFFVEKGLIFSMSLRFILGLKFIFIAFCGL